MAVLQTPLASYVCTLANDGCLKLYSGKEELSEQSTLLFGRNLQESLCLTTLGPEHLMLMIGGYNSQMHVYTIGSKDDQFTYRFSALGHLNSIKSIAISEELTPGSETRYVASGS
jgi:hypothetical protein